MVIRSFRRVFQLERRIYRVDNLRLNPGGVPVRLLVYFMALVLACALAARLPLFGIPFSQSPWYLRTLALPAIGTALLAVLRLDGRPGHLAAYAVASHWFGPSRLAGGRPRRRQPGPWWPGELIILPDGGEARIHAMRSAGPVTAVIAVDHRRRLTARAGLTRPRIVVGVAAGTRGGRIRGRRLLVVPRRGRLELRRRALERSP